MKKALSEYWYFQDDVVAVAKLLPGKVNYFIECAQKAYSEMWQGGNQWSAWDSFLSFFRHVVKLDIDYSKYKYWERLAEISGPRIMHSEFCMVSDRPKVLKIDSQNLPHCEDGPFCEWRDGSKIWAYHGVFVPGWIIERPEQITPEKIQNESNAEIRRVMMEKMGLRRYILESKAVVLDRDDHEINWKRALLKVKEDVILFVADPSTGRNYPIQVDPSIKTCEQADHWMYRRRKTWDGKPYKQLART
ncbi:MAG: hypothetical protein KGL39_31975 [Patescibacteria group bacterium]|nr:hypothetical protein [Patescibacteria group bacterium]